MSVTKPVDVFVTEAGPHYQVWADGRIVQHLTVRLGFPQLTLSQQRDIAANYRDAIATGLLPLPAGRRSA